MYYPKSQVETNLYTPGAEYATVMDGKEYVGNYWRTSKGLYYTGKNPQDVNVRELVKSIAYDDPFGLALTEANDDIPVYTNNNMAPYEYIQASGKKIIEKMNVVNTTPFPTKNNYTNKNFERYFLKRTTNYQYTETDNLNYDLIISKNPKSQFEIYSPIKLSWRIYGKLLDVYKQNYNTVQHNSKIYEWIKFDLFFKNRYAKYFKPVNDDPNYTKGGELKIERTNEEYIGYYHVHPLRGVLMEGKKHINSPHDTLVLIKDGEVLTKKRVGVSEEVGTSRRTNISSRGSGGY
jgi:hypothetical protein|tara:strand:- start:17 stop:889 length:873 start_codon:yes stop_codon:yes gene_type:complete